MLKRFIIFLMIVACVLADEDKQQKENRFKLRFNSHLRKHGKRYEDLPEEVRVRRRDNYMKNLDMIEKHNNEGKHAFKLGSNEYSDRDRQRFVSDMCRAYMPATPRALPLPPSITPKTNPALATVDWRNRYTQPIANQGGCGSCWAFASAAVIEAYNEIRGRGRTALSQQNIVDCNKNENACCGGSPKNTFDWLKNSYGNKLATAANYGYTAGAVYTNCSLPQPTRTCKVVPTVPLNYTSTFQYGLGGSDALLKQYISNYGPIAVAVHVSDYGFFQNYKSGIFSEPYCSKNCATVNHIMVAVGYGVTTTGQQYFIIRNSWGTTWGEMGYMRMAMGNTCNLACYAIGVE